MTEDRVHQARFARPARGRLAFFCLYAAALFTGTHWPLPDLGLPSVNNLDKLLHFGAFGLWDVFLVRLGLFGPMLGRRNLSLCFLATIVYGAIDELLQGLPFIHRHVEWADYGANALGAACATGALALIGKFFFRKD